MKCHNNRGGWLWLIVFLFLLCWLKIEIQFLLSCQGPLFITTTTKKLFVWFQIRPNATKVLFCCSQHYSFFFNPWHMLLIPFKANDEPHAFHSPFFGFLSVVSNEAQCGFLYSLCSQGVPWISSLHEHLRHKLKAFLLPWILGFL